MGDKEDLRKFVAFCETPLGQDIMKAEADFLRRELRGCDKILDIGCGIGAHERLLPEFNILGVDASGLFVKYATEHNEQRNKQFIQGDATHLNPQIFKDNTFDAVFSVATIEFIVDYELAIREIARVLKSNGKMILMILNTQSRYVKEHQQNVQSYYRRIKHYDREKIKLACISKFQLPRAQYFLGIRDERTFDTEDPNLAVLYVIIGKKI